MNQQINLHDGAGGNSSWQWTLVSVPPGSAAVLAGPTTANPTFIPDLPGTYRIQMITNGGGPGNIQIKVARVRYDSSGALLVRGWCLPAWGEQAGEANYPGNFVDWAEPFNFIFSDLETLLSSIGSTISISLVAGLQSVGPGSFQRVGVQLVDLLSRYPVSIGTRNRHINFEAFIAASSISRTTTAILQNATDNVTLATFTDMTPNGNLYSSSPILGGVNSAKQLEVQVMTDGVVLATDRAMCFYAALIVTYS